MVQLTKLRNIHRNDVLLVPVIEYLDAVAVVTGRVGQVGEVGEFRSTFRTGILPDIGRFRRPRGIVGLRVTETEEGVGNTAVRLVLHSAAPDAPGPAAGSTIEYGVKILYHFHRIGYVHGLGGCGRTARDGRRCRRIHFFFLIVEL